MSNKEYNFFIKPTEVDNVIENKDDKSTAYIILQNNTLHSKHQELKEELETIKNERDELESLNENLERSKGCIQGLAKNQYLLSQEKTKQVSYYKKQLNYLYDQNEIIYYMSIPYILLILFHITNMKVSITVMIMTTAAQINHYIKNYNWMKQLTKNNDIKEIEDEIKALDKSNDYLHELIDNY